MPRTKKKPPSQADNGPLTAPAERLLRKELRLEAQDGVAQEHGLFPLPREEG